ncbi:hypothetical protein SAMN05216389_11149 [Oceanobacillus limi]|uniref:Uncharacterized protein n=1 Tax=Oceanobacillus limi TaxID=930131 RepID=A0A1I0EDM8_9BACI|nr:hypothetical protein [Oceanobacillus limi]SET43074.1 hypothetical protein SAMN05216389_11149 [Oceanobacillus limi]
MRKSTLIIGTLSAILTSASVILAQRTSDKPAEIQWIDGEDSDDMNEPKPMFYVGDDVLIYDPYTAEFFSDGETIAPTKYEITDVKYDEEHSVFRYRLEGGDPNDWYSEDWLSLPATTDFIREWEPEGMTEAEREKLSEELDDSARQTAIDYYLDMLTYGSENEKAYAERLLTELTKGE